MVYPDFPNGTFYVKINILSNFKQFLDDIHPYINRQSVF